jgi:hypothetical protein
MKKISCFIVFLLLAVLISAPFWPWKAWVHDTIQQQLAKKNIHAEFTVENIFPGTLILKDIEIKDFPTAFDTLEVHYSPREFLSKRLAISDASLHSKDGEITLQDFKVDLFGSAETSFTLFVKNVPLGFIMRLLTNDKANATGMVSGKFPLTLHQDGSLTINSGTLSTANSGTLTVRPDAIPGNNDQIELVRAALSDFRYQEFSLEANSKKDKKLSMLLQLRGNNPDVYNGREIKLNVRLQGDLINLLRQSILPMNDPKQLLEQK